MRFVGATGRLKLMLRLVLKKKTPIELTTGTFQAEKSAQLRTHPKMAMEMPDKTAKTE